MTTTPTTLKITMRRILIPICLAALAACSGEGAEQQRPIYQAVGATQVRAQAAFGIERSFTGVVAAARSADIAFEFGGTVQSMMVDEGDRVAEGDLLAALDTTLLDVEQRQLAAQLEEAEANLRLAESSLSRLASLESSGFASKQRRDELEASRDATRAGIQRLRAALDGNRVRKQKSRLLAPFAGTVGERYVGDGGNVVPGRAVLRLLETAHKEAHIGVPKQLASQLRAGQAVDLVVGDATLGGTVLAVGGELKLRSHTATVRVGLPDTTALIGSLARLRLQDSIETPGFVVPQSALTASMRGLWRVYVLRPARGRLYQVEARDLQVRYSDDNLAYVEGGLKDGELVVSKGVHKIVPGQLVLLGDSAVGGGSVGGGSVGGGSVGGGA